MRAERDRALRLAWVLIALAALLGATAACGSAAVIPGEPPGTVVWDPAGSDAGQAQADSRLERPVRFWRAGLSLTEVFAGIEAQTGVKLALWPENDPSLNIHVTLFLNPEKPPSLRDLLAQLNWAADTTLLVTDNPEGEKRTYYLLWSGSDASDSISDRERSSAESETARKARQAKENLTRLREYLAALSLSREELLAHYQGQDDQLLLSLLDPRRRGVLEVLSRVPEEELQQAMLQNEVMRRDLSKLTPEEQAFWKQSLCYRDDWLANHHARVWIQPDWYSPHLGAVAMEVLPDGREQNYLLDGTRTDATLIAISLSRGQIDGPGSEIELRRQLGETITAEQETEYTSQWWKGIEQERDLQRAAKEAREAAKTEGSLTPQLRELLLATALPDFRGPKQLWELQEALAKASGLNIVSDALCDLPRLWGPGASSTEAAAQTARALLDKIPTRPRWTGGLWDVWTAAHVAPDLAWEWKGGGSFLRFRSAYRTLWRGSQLPADAVAEMNYWVDPQLKSNATGRRPVKLETGVSLSRLAKLASRLTLAQARYGGLLIYGNPSEVNEQLRSAFRQEVQSNISYVTLYQWAASLTDASWKQLQNPGLRLGDLTLNQRTLLRRDLFLKAYVNDPAYKDLSVRILPEDGSAGDRTKPQRYLILLTKQGRKIQEYKPTTFFETNLSRPE